MSPIFNEEHAVLFLGIADFFESDGPSFPVGTVDLFQLSQHKSHIFYPAVIPGNVWILLISANFVREADFSKWELRIVDDENNTEIGKVSFEPVPTLPSDTSQPQPQVSEGIIGFFGDASSSMLHFKSNLAINHPGKYTINSHYDGEVTSIGSVYFHYQKALPLTPDQIKAIESNPEAAGSLRLTLGCGKCPTTMKVYTGLSRLPDLEKKGWIWQTELEGDFACKCGKTKYSLKYVKESLHGLLLKDLSREYTGLSYVRRYSHSQVKKIVGEFRKLLDEERLEPPIQRFIEQYPILLSRFHAKRLFIKPRIIGKFVADFGVVDSQNQLWLIELERPSLQLFRKDGHATQGLMHAYGQVTDWLQEYSKYSAAILEGMQLTPEEVVSVRGAVIAGRSKGLAPGVLQRHLSNPPYPHIEFMTCDDLGESLLEISKKIT